MHCSHQPLEVFDLPLPSLLLRFLLLRSGFFQRQQVLRVDFLRHVAVTLPARYPWGEATYRRLRRRRISQSSSPPTAATVTSTAQAVKFSTAVVRMMASRF